MIENFRERETTTRLRRQDHWCDEIKMTRSAAPMSFGLRTRTRTRSVMTAPMSNENKISNDDIDELWVENENENDAN